MVFGSARSARARRRVLSCVAITSSVAVIAAGIVVMGAAAAQAVTLPHTTPDDTAMVGGTSALATVSVRSIVQVGNLIWVGGDFNQILDGSGHVLQSAGDLAVFNASTGALATGVSIPTVSLSTGESTVYELSLGPNGLLYFAGDFNSVNGATRHGAAAINPTTGALQPFAPAGGNANSILATSNAIYVGAQTLKSFTLSGAATSGFNAPQVFTDPNIRAHTTVPQIRDIQISGNTLIAPCQCDSLTDNVGTRTVKAVVEINATTGNWINWRPANLPDSSAAFGIHTVINNFPGTSTPTVFLAAGGNDFTAAFNLATGKQDWKEDTSGSSQAIAWYQGSLVIGGHFDWTQKPAGPTCNDNQNPGNDPTDCYLSPHLVMMNPSTGDIVLSNGKPWNPGICCAYNGVWTLTTGNDGTTLHVGGEFTRVGATSWTFNPSDDSYTESNDSLLQEGYARFSGPPSGTQTLNVSETGPGTVTSNTGGINCGTTCTANIATGTVVTLTATPTAGGNLFTGWGGDCSGTATTCQVTMSQTRNVSATFTPPQFALTVTNAGTGTGSVTSSPAGVTCPSTCTANFNTGQVVTLTEAPAGGSLFTGWSGTGAGTCTTASTCQVTMSAAKSITATFSANTVLLTVMKSGTGTGTLTSNVGGIDCGTTCSANIAQGTQVTLTETPAAGSAFTGWSGGGCTGTATTCKVTMSSAQTVTAAFTPSWTLTVTKAGSGGGTVSSSPTGINCGATCSAKFVDGTLVTLTETPTATDVFFGWGGPDAGVCGYATTCQVSMTAARNITATFDTAKNLNLTIVGTGTVTSNPPGVNCTATCTPKLALGGVYTLTATPGVNFAFSAWSGTDGTACGTATTCQVTMSKGRTVKATFTPAVTPLNVTVAGSGTGTVTSSPAGITCTTGTCSASFNSGQVVTLTATANAGSTFTGWSGTDGAGCGTVTTCQVTMSAARSVTATFTKVFGLSVTIAGSGSGTVSSSPAGITCTTGTCSANFTTGTVVTLTASASSGSTFTGWSGPDSGSCSGTSCTLTMSAARSVTATFTKVFGLSVTIAGSGAGTVTSSPAGITCTTGTCSANFNSGQAVTLTAAANAGSTFTGWSGTDGAGCGTATTCQVTMSQARSVTATFTKVFGLSVTIAGSGSGTVSSSPAGITCTTGTCSANFNTGTVVTLTASANAGSTFAGWSGTDGAGCGVATTCQVTMSAARSVTATFVPVYTLIVATAGTGTGTITGSPGTISCASPTTGTCSNIFVSGATVTLTQTADAGSTFTGWSGDCSGTGTCVVTMSQARSVTATFDAVQELLTVNVGGTGTGSVVSSPAGITCPTVSSPCTDDFNQGQVVTLTATADTGNVFTTWSGPDVGSCTTATSCQVTMSTAKNITATFVPIYALNVTLAGSGGGTVTSSPAGITCTTGTCSANFTSGATVDLTATPDGNSNFTGWTGDCTGSTTCEVTMDQIRNVTATFDAVPQTLTVNVGGTGTGTVTSSPAGITCPSASVTCTHDFNQGQIVTLTATPDADMAFTGWTDDGLSCGTATTCQVTMNAAKSVTATFASAFDLEVSEGGTGTGTVTSDAGAIDCPTMCSDNYASGTVVTLTATADPGSAFTGWTGDCSVEPCQVTMDQARSVTATFDVIPETLTVTVGGTGTGTVSSSPAGITCPTASSPCSHDFNQNQVVTLTATPDTNMAFTGWTDDGASCGAATTCPVTMSAAKNVTATFVPTQMLNVATGGSGGGTVTSDVGGINCASPGTGTCSHGFAHGDAVNVTATPDGASTFAGWSGGPCNNSTTSPCPVMMNQDWTFTADFTAVQRPLAVTVNGAGSGSVASSPAGISCPSTCSTTYANGTAVTLTATPGTGSNFTGWSGDCSGTGTCSLTMGAAHAVTATFAPTASCGQILFTSNRTGNNDIFSMSSAGSSVVNLTNNAASDTTAAWSSDCQKIVFVSDRNGGTHIWVMNANGSNPVQLTTGAATDSDPTWSHDGTKIAFASTGTAGGSRNVYVMNANGSGVTQLTTDSGTSESYAPSFSPDGSKIAFVSSRTGSGQIYVMAPTPGATQTRLTMTLAACLAPDWSPDGTKIVFTAKATGTNQVETMSATGTGYTQIVSDGKNDTHPSWSPDGTQITYSSNATTGAKIQIFVVNANGTSAHAITSTSTTENEPSWSN